MEMMELIAKMVGEIKKQAVKIKDSRGVSHDKYFASVTSLLSCPQKWHYARKYPELAERIASEPTIDIVKGFEWESIAKEAAVRALDNAGEVRVVFEPPEVVYLKGKKDGKRIDIRLVSHPDILIETQNQDRDFIIELKAPTYVIIQDRAMLSNMDGLAFSMGEDIKLPRRYILQVALQKRFHMESTGRKVEAGVFGTSVTRHKGSYKRVYFFRYISETATMEDIKKLVWAFVNKPVPRERWECRYCPWKALSICEGTEEFYPVRLSFEKETKGVQDNEIIDLVERYLAVKRTERELYEKLKAMIPEGQIFAFDDKIVGWIDASYNEWDYLRLAKKFEELGYHNLFNETVRMRAAGIQIVKDILGPDYSDYRRVVEYKKFVVGYNDQLRRCNDDEKA